MQTKERWSGALGFLFGMTDLVKARQVDRERASGISEKFRVVPHAFRGQRLYPCPSHRSDRHHAPSRDGER